MGAVHSHSLADSRDYQAADPDSLVLVDNLDPPVDIRYSELADTQNFVVVDIQGCAAAVHYQVENSERTEMPVQMPVGICYQPDTLFTLELENHQFIQCHFFSVITRTVLSLFSVIQRMKRIGGMVDISKSFKPHNNDGRPMHMYSKKSAFDGRCIFCDVRAACHTNEPNTLINHKYISCCLAFLAVQRIFYGFHIGTQLYVILLSLPNTFHSNCGYLFKLSVIAINGFTLGSSKQQIFLLRKIPTQSRHHGSIVLAIATLCRIGLSARMQKIEYDMTYAQQLTDTKYTFNHSTTG